jgi:putative membrane-bound dehydrogenase-like protein
MSTFTRRILPLALCIALMIACREQKSTSGGLSPAQALSSFQLPEGFSIELVASEPLVSDPVAMDVDENGNLFVVEMHGYPLDTTGSGKIKWLSDTNGDGLPDKATLFADRLRLPTGIMRWKKGWLVVDVPDILYLEDSDSDGKADIRRTVLTGMALTNPQHITNTPVYGLDNWIYMAHMGTITPKVSMMFNDTGSLIRFPGLPGAPTLPRNADGRNFRFNPDKQVLEMLAGESQYGHSFDNWGHHFCVANADHIFFEAIGARYLRRNPDLLVADASDYISDHGDACAVFPITHNPENQLLTDRGVVTSACGITYYNGGLFPDSFNQVSFVAEPTSNIVHADRLHQNGASFTASRLYPDREFLASTDGWFRPVQMYIGPDGALYVIDYYRQIIEHPEWLSEEVINSGALYNGANQGRIYRITPKGTRKMDWTNALSLGRASTPELVQALAGNNIWWRRNVQRLLMDRRDPAAIPLLRQMADTTASPTAMVHALRTLEGMGALDQERLVRALRHPEPGVRENALQMAETRIAEYPGLSAVLSSMQADPDPRVRFQLLCTLGDLDDRASEAARQSLLLRDIEDRWMQVAALSAVRGKEWALLESILPELRNQPSEGKALFFGQVAGLIGLSQRGDDIRKLTEMATRNPGPVDDWWQAALLQGLGRGLAAKGIPAESIEAEKAMLLSTYRPSFSPPVQDAALDLLGIIGPPSGHAWDAARARAEKVAMDTAQFASFRVAAFKVLALDKRLDFGPMVETVIRTGQHTAVQQAALKGYQRYSDEKSAALVVKHWDSLYFPLSSLGMEVLLGSTAGMRYLLDALEKKKIATAAIPWSGKVDLMNHDDAAIRSRARALLAPEIEGREKVVSDYQEALSMEGNIARGQAVFESACVVCHQYEGQYGKIFGPDLGSIRNRDKASIMTDILQPNRSIAVQYDLWTVVMKNGEKRSGIIHAETPTSVQLTPPGGDPVTLSRADIHRMEIGKTSAMPEGLEAVVSRQQMADLLAFLTGK